MSLSNKKKTQSTSDIFDDDFEVIYEGDLPDISIDDDDDYRDVLSGLSDIDHTDYIKKNDYDRLTKKLKNKNKKAGKKNKKQSKKDNFFDTAYYDDDIFDELDDDLYDDEYEDDYDNEYEDDCDDIRTDCGSHYCNHRLLQNSGVVSADQSVCLYYARYTGRSTVIFLLLWNCIIQCICKKYDTSYRSSGSYEF